jgi:putative membrane protein
VLGAALIGVGAVYLGVGIPALPHTLVGVALGLLLVFRTNASYSRYAEARTMLGQLVWASRDLARQLGAYLPGEGEPAPARADIGRYIGAFFRLLTQNLRREEELHELKDRLKDTELAELGELSRGRELALGNRISDRLAWLNREGWVSDELLRSMDGNVTAMVQAVTGCERIANTPVPFAYAQHTKVFLLLFCFTLPFVMVESLQVWTPVATAVLAFAMFGIDEIGVEIDEPFGRDANDLPMEALGDTVDDAVRRALLQSDVVLAPPGEPVDELFVAMAE